MRKGEHGRGVKDFSRVRVWNHRHPTPLAVARDPPPAGEGKARHASSPVFFVRRRVRRYSLQRAPQTRGAERRQTRRFARPPERLRGRPRRLARRLLSVATERRLPALRLRLAPPAWPETQAPGPRFLGRGKAASPSPASSSRRGRSAPRSVPRASRERGYEPRPQAPPPTPPSFASHENAPRWMGGEYGYIVIG